MRRCCAIADGKPSSPQGWRGCFNERVAARGRLGRYQASWTMRGTNLMLGSGLRTAEKPPAVSGGARRGVAEGSRYLRGRQTARDQQVTPSPSPLAQNLHSPQERICG